MSHYHLITKEEKPWYLTKPICQCILLQSKKFGFYTSDQATDIRPPEAIIIIITNDVTVFLPEKDLFNAILQTMPLP
jgi:hypothetical protein